MNPEQPTDEAETEAASKQPPAAQKKETADLTPEKDPMAGTINNKHPDLMR